MSFKDHLMNLRPRVDNQCTVEDTDEARLELLESAIAAYKTRSKKKKLSKKRLKSKRKQGRGKSK